MSGELTIGLLVIDSLDRARDDKNLDAMSAGWLEMWMRLRALARNRRVATAIGPITSLVRCRRGVVAFEFILVLPVLMLVISTILYLSIALNNELILTAAAEQGVQTLSLG